MTPSLEGWPTNAKEAPSPYEVRLAPLDTNPVFQNLGDVRKSISLKKVFSVKYLLPVVLKVQTDISTSLGTARIYFPKKLIFNDMSFPINKYFLIIHNLAFKQDIGIPMPTDRE